MKAEDWKVDDFSHTIKVVDTMPDYRNDPHFVQKSADARAFISLHGLPDIGPCKAGPSAQV
jgi:hypothetical protein